MNMEVEAVEEYSPTLGEGMTIGRYNVDAKCSCRECSASYVQNVISTMVVSPTGRWCLYEDYAKLLKV